MRRGVFHRRSRNTNGHWFDLAAGKPIDSRFRLRRSISTAIFSAVLLMILTLLAGIGWWLIQLQNGAVDPKVIAEQIRPSVYVVECGSYMGTAFAIDSPISEPYETAVLTAAHVIDECPIGGQVTLRNAAGTLEGTVLGKNPSGAVENVTSSTADVAVIGVRSKLATLPVAPQVEQGDWLLIMGHPWDYEFAFALGLASQVEVSEILTDAALNEGNSGGPAVDSQGRVVGFVSYYPYRSDLYSANLTGIYDRADGLAVLKRLNVLCELPSSLVGNCSLYRLPPG